MVTPVIMKEEQVLSTRSSSTATASCPTLFSPSSAAEKELSSSSLRGTIPIKRKRQRQSRGFSPSGCSPLPSSLSFPSAQMTMRKMLSLSAFLVLTAVVSFSSGEPYGSRSYGGSLGSQDAIEEHDLLQAIRVPFDDPRTQYFESGLDGFPAYGLREGADIKSHYRLFLPDRLYRDFALLATVKPERREPSFLFAVVNPLDTIVQFGLKISPSLTSSHHTISLLYTDVGSHLVTQTLATFEVPLMTRKWNRFALKVVGDNVTLFLNCRDHSSQIAMRNPKELSFDSASTLYIGQAGPILKGNFQGHIHVAINKTNQYYRVYN